MNRRDFLKVACGAPILLATPNILQARIPDPPMPLAPVDPPFECFTTGLPTLDCLLGGGIHKGDLGLVIGTTGSGKSVLLRHIWRANCPGDEVSRRWPYVGQGSNDLLRMWRENDNQSEGYLILDDDYSNVRVLKEECLKLEEAALLTIPCNRQPWGGGVLVLDCGYEPAYVADFVISVRPTPEYMNLVLIKNRRGYLGEVHVRMPANTTDTLVEWPA